jgi:hypothetical protein
VTKPKLSIGLAAPVALALALICASTTAHAVQVDMRSTNPTVTRVMECLNCTVTFTWTIVNTGVPVNAPATLTFLESVGPFFGTDIDNDVLQEGQTTQGMAGQCGATLAAASSCTVQAIYNVRDGDPFDRDPAVDFGKWTAGFALTWSVPLPGGGVEQQTIINGQKQVEVMDDEMVPEPGAWAFVTLGFALLGAAARLRRAAALAS